MAGERKRTNIVLGVWILWIVIGLSFGQVVRREQLMRVPDGIGLEFQIQDIENKQAAMRDKFETRMDAMQRQVDAMVKMQAMDHESIVKALFLVQTSQWLLGGMIVPLLVLIFQNKRKPRFGEKIYRELDDNQ